MNTDQTRRGAGAAGRRGDPTPSKEDIEITRRLREVGDLVGVHVFDHVIIGKGCYVSLVDDG